MNETLSSRILGLARQGLTRAEIVNAVGCSPKYVTNVCSEARAAGILDRPPRRMVRGRPIEDRPFYRVLLTLPPEQMAYFMDEADKRALPVTRVIIRTLQVVAQDRMVCAVLDDDA